MTINVNGIELEVLESTGVYDYSWSEFGVMRGDDGHLYVGDTSGCSCNSWGEDLRTEGDFENGDKLGLQRSIRQFAEEYPYSVSATDVLDAVGAVATFRTVPEGLG